MPGDAYVYQNRDNVFRQNYIVKLWNVTDKNPANMNKNSCVIKPKLFIDTEG